MGSFVFPLLLSLYYSFLSTAYPCSLCLHSLPLHTASSHSFSLQLSFCFTRALSALFFPLHTSFFFTHFFSLHTFLLSSHFLSRHTISPLYSLSCLFARYTLSQSLSLFLLPLHSLSLSLFTPSSASLYLLSSQFLLPSPFLPLHCRALHSLFVALFALPSSSHSMSLHSPLFLPLSSFTLFTRTSSSLFLLLHTFSLYSSHFFPRSHSFSLTLLVELVIRALISSPSSCLAMHTGRENDKGTNAPISLQHRLTTYN